MYENFSETNENLSTIQLPVDLSRTQSFKNMSVFFYDSKMSFNQHVNYIVDKANKRYYTMRFLSKRLNGPTLLKMYKTYILPILKYSNLCLSYNKTQSQQLESVQSLITSSI